MSTFGAPWRIVSRVRDSGYTKIYGLRDAQGRKLEEADQRDPAGISIGEADAVWNLIAAAPDLLAALKDIANRASNGLSYRKTEIVALGQIEDMARAAIAKATTAE